MRAVLGVLATLVRSAFGFGEALSIHEAVGLTTTQKHNAKLKDEPARRS